jgi:hypothetical protein
VTLMKEPHQLRPGNRYLREGEARKALGDLVSRKTALIAICRRCKHRRLLLPTKLAMELGSETKVVDVQKRLRCGNCRGYGIANLHESSR